MTVAEGQNEIINYLDSLIEDKITDVPGNGTGTDAPGNGTGTDVPGNGTGTDVPGNGTGTDAPGNGTGTDAPGNGTGTDVPGNGTGNETSNNNVAQNQGAKPQTGMNMSLPVMLGGIMTTLSGIVGIYRNRRK